MAARKLKTAKQLAQEIETLLPLDDRALREKLELLAAGEPFFAEGAAAYGYRLYGRDRILFRPLILAHFTGYGPVPKDIEAWMAEVDRANDVELYRALYAWKNRGKVNEWKKELVARFRAAPTKTARASELQKLDIWGVLDEATALELYRIDPEASPKFIERHLELWKRKFWRELFELARSKNDLDFAYTLYRQQISGAEWKKDVLALAEKLRDPAELDKTLEQHHPRGWDLDLVNGFWELVRARGRDVVPYVLRHMTEVYARGWGERRAYKAMVAHAEKEGWDDVWAALLRSSSHGNEYDEAVADLVDGTGEDGERRRKLRLLSGVIGEMNFPGLGVAWVRPLSEKTAIKLYGEFPDLLRGPFRAHVAGAQYAKLIDLCIASGDEILIDYFASRVATRDLTYWKGANPLLDRLTEYYLTADARRLVGVIGQIPAFVVWSYDRLVRTNRLARLLFERNLEEYLSDSTAVRDLLESPSIFAQILAYRVLGMRDPRAEVLARENADLLIAALLRSLHRKTRVLAFVALANAATTPELARRIVDRAREAWDLPDTRYPKEKLLGLIAQILSRYPELRGAREQPQVYAS
jgi:hypothetical protein